MPPKDDPRILSGAVIAVARLGKIWTNAALVDPQALPWYSGPIGWQLLEIERLEPIPCKGAQGLWRMPPHVLAEIDRQLEGRS